MALASFGHGARTTAMALMPLGSDIFVGLDMGLAVASRVDGAGSHQRRLNRSTVDG